MNTVKVLHTTISETSLSEVSNVLNSESSLKVAICNTNTVVTVSYTHLTLPTKA